MSPGEGTRPLSDRVKQALFSSLEAELGALWPTDLLDLFAGSGAVGIEALSRGSPRVVLVEREERAVAAIRENLHRAGFAIRSGRSRRDAAWRDARPALDTGVPEPDVEVVRDDVARYLASPPLGGGFTAAVLDPPYGSAAMLPALQALGDAPRGWVMSGAVIVAKHFWRDAQPSRIGTLSRLRERRFGETMLTFYRCSPESAGAPGDAESHEAAK